MTLVLRADGAAAGGELGEGETSDADGARDVRETKYESRSEGGGGERLVGVASRDGGDGGKGSGGDGLSLDSGRQLSAAKPISSGSGGGVGDGREREIPLPRPAPRLSPARLATRLSQDVRTAMAGGGASGSKRRGWTTVMNTPSGTAATDGDNTDGDLSLAGERQLGSTQPTSGGNSGSNGGDWTVVNEAPSSGSGSSREGGGATSINEP